MREEPEPPGPIGFGLTGSWIELVEPESPADLDQFAQHRSLNPSMGAGAALGESHYAPPMIIREKRSGDAVGVVENHELPGGVAVFVIYLDRERGRAGYGLEATALYVSHLFDSGARLVTAEVLSLNTEVIGIMRKAGWPPQARLREHVYTAGRFWDVLVYSMDREDWLRALSRYQRHLPGGGRRPAALGIPRPNA